MKYFKDKYKSENILLKIEKKSSGDLTEDALARTGWLLQVKLSRAFSLYYWQRFKFTLVPLRSRIDVSPVVQRKRGCIGNNSANKSKNK